MSILHAVLSIIMVLCLVYIGVVIRFILKHRKELELHEKIKNRLDDIRNDSVAWW